MQLLSPIKGIGTTPGIYVSQDFGNVYITTQPITYNGKVYPAGTNFYKELFGLEGHNGEDIACPVGTPIYAEHDGILTPFFNSPSYGNYFKLDFEEAGFGYQVIEGHLSQILKNGPVRAGELVAKSGNTGASSGPHLHRGLGQFKNGQLLNSNNGFKGAIDPALYTKGKTLQLINDNGTVYLVAGNTDKRVTGISDPDVLRALFGDEVIIAGPIPSPATQTLSEGFIIHKN